jgi:adenosine deaminase
MIRRTSAATWTQLQPAGRRFELSDFDKARLAANSIHSSFASEERKAELLAELNGLDAVR